MGANAQTSVPAFTAGQVLTAAQVTQINTGIPVFASSTERDAAFGGTGEKTLAEGQMAYLEDTNTTQYYDGSSWAAVGAARGLAFIDETTVGSAVASVTISSVFSATYDTYLVVVNGVAGSVVAQLQLNYAGATTSYYGATRAIDYAGSLTNVLANNAAHLYVGQVGTAVQQNSAIWIGGPFISERTSLHGTWIRGAIGGYMMGSHDVAASYTGFTIAPSSGTITGGTISTFGVVKS